ncbi:MAG: FAD:protein FMN transferase [Opitutales bacterium]
MTDTHRFEHPAMNTELVVRFRGVSRSRAASAAGACFAEIDRLEDCLSRYRDGSDIARVNRLQAGESMLIAAETHDCLHRAAEAFARTGGLFDISLGRRYEYQKRHGEGPAMPDTGRLLIDPERPRISCESPGRVLDLGGIGKGFALDRVAAWLSGEGFDDVLVSAGPSTHLAIGGGSWPLAVADGETPIELHATALSVSGDAVQGAHVVHPLDASMTPVWCRLWLIYPEAALADAFSTAALFLSADELKALCEENAGLQIVRTEAP